MSLHDLAMSLHLASTLYMFGLIWFVQVAHYPLFSNVGEPAFRDYELRNLERTTRVVVAPMIIETGSALALLWLLPSQRVPLLTGAALLAIIWLSTFLLQVPAHARLSEGFDAEAHRRLVRTNWIRTFAWSARAVVAIALVVGP